MDTRSTFGERLRDYLGTLDGHRPRAWVGRQLGYRSADAAITKMCTGELRPSRAQVLRIGELLGLSPLQVDDLLARMRSDLRADGCARRKRRRPEHYQPLGEDERRTWGVVHGPWDLPRWRELVATVTQNA